MHNVAAPALPPAFFLGDGLDHRDAHDIDDALRADTARRIADIRASDEGREGLQSFLGKRAPGWLPAA